MRTITLHPLLMLCAISIGIAATSCNHKDLCIEEINTTKLRVVYDWSDAPQANPAGMCVYFYSTDNPDAFYRFDFNNTSGGEIELPQGNYKVISYNNDTEAVRFSAVNSFEGHMAFTRDGNILEPLYGNAITSSTSIDNGERVVITPDELWGCHATDVSISDHGVKYTYYRYDDTRSGEAVNSGIVHTTESGDQTITLFPHDMLCHYSYEVRNVENIEHVSRVSAAISGMSPSMTISDESLDPEPITLPIPGQAEPDTHRITGRFLTFGQNPINKASHKMTFFVVMDDGKKYMLKDADNLDVTSQVDNAPDRRHVHIIIDNLKLPRSSEITEGWIPTVDDWGIQEEELII